MAGAILCAGSVGAEPPETTLTPDREVRRVYEESVDTAAAMWVLSGTVGVVEEVYAVQRGVDKRVEEPPRGVRSGLAPLDNRSPHHMELATPPVASIQASSADQWQALVSQYDWSVQRALAVIRCESSGDPLAASNWPYVGLFQIDVNLHRWTYEQLIDPAINVAAAYELWSRRGWQPWPVCGQP